MGVLSRFDLTDLHRRYGFRIVVETGTGLGDGTAHAATMPFVDAVLTCELEPELYRRATERFKWNPKVSVRNGLSFGFLEDVCQEIGAEPALFWLDAHFPGADYGIRGRGDEKADAVRLPLEEELAIIADRRFRGGDVVIADDLRIYEDGPFQHGNVPPDVRPFCPAKRDAGFIKRLMNRTHAVELLYDHEGYVLMTPKAIDDG